VSPTSCGQAPWPQPHEPICAHSPSRRSKRGRERGVLATPEAAGPEDRSIRSGFQIELGHLGPQALGGTPSGHTNHPIHTWSGGSPSIPHQPDQTQAQGEQSRGQFQRLSAESPSGGDVHRCTRKCDPPTARPSRTSYRSLKRLCGLKLAR